MARRSLRAGSARSDSLWRVMLLLLVAVAVPTASVLWFMTEAVRNERLAVRQKLMEVYHGQLVALEHRVEVFWQEKLDALAATDLKAPAPEVFDTLVRDKLADSIIVHDTSGRITYPNLSLPRTVDEPAHPAAWQRARQREFERADYDGAASEYAEIAHQTTGVDARARALQAQMRCLIKAGDIQAAIGLLTDELMQDGYRLAADSRGRLIVPSVQGLALGVIGDEQDAAFRRVAESLIARLSDYRDRSLPADQRRFLMRLMLSLSTDETIFPTLQAEELAARYIDADLPLPETPSLRPSGLPEVWHMSAPTGQIVALFYQQAVIDGVRSLIAGQGLPADVTVEVLPPAATPRRPLALDSVPLGEVLAGWRLVLYVSDDHLLDAAADRQIAAYLWTGLLVVAVVTILTLLSAGSLRGQVRLARLRNDLVATVSHELKTPLSSMRLLVDSLLDEKQLNEPKVREYLQLVAKENERLSHLIDSFLTFSRMQRGKRAFKFAQASPGAIATAAAGLVSDKFKSAHGRLDVEIDPDLPPINADADALVTVVLNLLDNAYKYTEDPRRVALRTYSKNGSVCFEVQDNGIGLSRRNAKRIFERFFQTDDRLSRTKSGCGLGLSIVEFVVAAHDGSVSVESELGNGSTFVVQIPEAPGPP